MNRFYARAAAARVLRPAGTAALLCTLLTMSAFAFGQSPAPDAVEPTVRVASPAEDETVSGTVTITADAAGPAAIAGVTFEVDGVTIGGEDVSAPWSVAWNTAASGPGSHVLTAVVRDAVGNAARSEIVPVVVGTATAPPFEPPPPANRSPNAAGDTLASSAGGPVAFTGAALLANDSDPDAHPIYVSLVASTSSGGGTIASHGADAYTYTPAAGFSGVDSFLYSVSDDHGGTVSATVSVQVTPRSVVPGLVLALHFDETSGTHAADASASGMHGAVRGAQFVPGVRGNALSFDGVDDWVTVADSAGSPLDLTAGMTLQAWVKPAVLQGWDTLVLKERGTGTMSYGLYVHDGGAAAGGANAPAAYLRIAGGDRAVRGSAALAPGAWTHLAATYDGANHRLYVNGALAATRPGTGAVEAGDGALRIGGNNAWAGEFFRGVIDEVRIYNRALSAAEIAAEMGGTPALPPPPPPPVNRVPVPANDTAATTAGQPVTIAVLANDSDPDGDSLSVSTVSPAVGGTAVKNADNTVTFTPAAGFSGAGSFTYSVVDGRGGAATGAVSVTVAPAPPAATLPAGLVAAFGFDLAGGTTASTAVDFAGGAGGAISGAAIVAGRTGSGEALSFDGVDDLVTVPDSAALDLTTRMTLSAWVNPATLSGGSGWRTILLKERGNGLAYALYANDGPGTPQPAGYIAVGGADRRVGAAPALPAGTWTHVAMTYDGAAMRLYVNGVLRVQRAQSGAAAVSAGALRIGGNTVFGQEFFAGLLDDVRIYNRALSASEVAADRDARLP